MKTMATFTAFLWITLAGFAFAQVPEPGDPGLPALRPSDDAFTAWQDAIREVKNQWDACRDAAARYRLADALSRCRIALAWAKLARTRESGLPDDERVRPWSTALGGFQSNIDVAIALISSRLAEDPAGYAGGEGSHSTIMIDGGHGSGSTIATSDDPSPKDPPPPKRKPVVLPGSAPVSTQGIRFACASVELERVAKERLDSLARELKEHPEILNLSVVGYGDDDPGTDLAKRRSAAVRDALVTRGIAPARLVPDTAPLPPEAKGKDCKDRPGVEFIVRERIGK